MSRTDEKDRSGRSSGFENGGFEEFMKEISRQQGVRRGKEIEMIDLLGETIEL